MTLLRLNTMTQCLVMSLLLTSSLIGESVELVSTPKGIILIVIDDIGYGDIDCLYPSSLETPSFDVLCKQSVCLTDFHVGTTCAPTRASLMTGRSVNAGGVWHTIAGRELLRENEQTMADVFQANGWKTGIFGKWHLGEGYPFSPRFRGFDVSVIHGGGGIGQGPDYWNNDYYSGVDHGGNTNEPDTYFENGTPIQSDCFCTDFWFKRATGFIKSSVDQKQPFFCYVPTNAAHGPFNAPHKAKQGFDGLVENVDDNIGRLEMFLDSEGIKDDVLLIFTTDNGTAGKRKGGLRNKKGSHYDGGHNVPCFLRWKNGGIGGSESDKRDVNSLTAAMDFLPTFIDMFNLEEAPGEKPLHGISIKEMLTDANYQPQPRTLVVDTQRGAELVKWKRACVMSDEVTASKITKKWRMTRKSKSTKHELYDFLTDRDTDNDIASSNSKVIDSLSQHYDAWWAEISAEAGPYPPFVVNPEREKELTLQAHSWINQDSSPWHQKHILNAGKGSGAHAIRFEQLGRYDVELRRWPREDGGAIASQSKQGTGQAIPAVKARLSIEGIGTQEQVIKPGDAAVVFTLDIKLTEATTINTAFLGSNNEVLAGAYYVYVKRSVDPTAD